MAKKLPNYPFRIEPDMRAEAEKRAKAERRSLNAWLQIAVEEKLNHYKAEEVRLSESQKQ